MSWKDVSEQTSAVKRALIWGPGKAGAILSNQQSTTQTPLPITDCNPNANVYRTKCGRYGTQSEGSKTFCYFHVNMEGSRERSYGGMSWATIRPPPLQRRWFELALILRLPQINQALLIWRAFWYVSGLQFHDDVSISSKHSTTVNGHQTWSIFLHELEAFFVLLLRPHLRVYASCLPSSFIIAIPSREVTPRSRGCSCGFISFRFLSALKWCSASR